MKENNQKNDEVIPIRTHSFSENWQERILIPTILAGVVGGGIGLMSKHRKVRGLGNICATYATNSAVVAACYCGMREFVRSSRQSEHGDLMNSAVGGIFSGALLGRLQGGHVGAMRYSAIFGVVGTAVDYAALRLIPYFKSFRDSMSGDDLKLPEWSPIQILDEEALAAKKAREQQLYAHSLRKEES